ncbi:phage tail tube protein [Escherichia coli]|nr:Ail/Lom family outer membrane beta-barrel protein [Escherichia coli]
MSSGAKVISAFIRETVAGTTPASGDWSLLKRTSWGVKPTQNKGENNEIGGSRMAQGATSGTVDVGGDVGTKFRWGQHDDFLASCFGAEWSGDSLTMGNERITFSLATYASDVGIASVVRGAQVGSWKMQIPNDGDITATVTFAGLDWESKADDTNFIKGEPVDSAGKLRYSFKEVSAVSLNGVAGGNGFCIDSFDIQFDNKLQTQLSYAGDKNRQLTCYSDTRWHEDSVRNRWFSVMAGPSVRVNEWFSAYAMAGMAYSRVSTFSGDYIRVTDNKGKTHDVLTGSDDGRHSNTSLAWGAGVQFNPTESVAVDVAYEGSGSGDWRTNSFIVGVGYKF